MTSARRHAGGGKQVVGALRAQAVGHREEAIDAAHVHLAGHCGELVDDDLRPGLQDDVLDPLGVERVGHDRLGAERMDRAGVRRARHADDLVTAGDELGDELRAVAPAAPATNTLIVSPSVALSERRRSRSGGASHRRDHRAPSGVGHRIFQHALSSVLLHGTTSQPQEPPCTPRTTVIDRDAGHRGADASGAREPVRIEDRLLGAARDERRPRPARAAGIGKSAPGRGARLAPAMQVLACAGIESETRLPFAALHQLLRPVLGHVDALPAVQARALRCALGLGRRAPRAVPGLARRAEPARRGRRGRLRCCASSTTPTGSTTRPPTRSSSSRGAWTPSRSPCSSPSRGGDVRLERPACRSSDRRSRCRRRPRDHRRASAARSRRTSPSG